MGKIEAKTVRGYIRTWRNWVHWCGQHQADPLSAQTKLEEFLHSPSKRGKLAPSVPRARWSRMAWFHIYVGSPIDAAQCVKPRTVYAGPSGDRQAVATEPELHVPTHPKLTFRRYQRTNTTS